MQYVIRSDGKYRKRNGGLTTSLSRANIVTTKKEAESITDEYGGDYVPVYLSLADSIRPIPIQSVWLVKLHCPIYGLYLYGPYFSLAEANEIFNSLLKDREDSLLGRYTVYHNKFRYGENRLGEKLEICEIRKT